MRILTASEEEEVFRMCEGLHHFEAEMALLGSMFLSPSVARRMSAMTDAKIFAREAHRQIFNAIRDAADLGAVDFLTVKRQLIEDGNLNSAGGDSYLLQIAEFVPSPLHADRYLGIVQSLHRKRLIQQLAVECRTNEWEQSEMLPYLAELARPLGHSAPVRPHELTMRKGASKVIPTGMPYIDQIAGGIRRGHCAMLLMGTGGGKSYFLIQRAINAAKRGYRVLYLALADLDELEITERMVAMLTGLMVYPTSDADVERWDQAISTISTWDILIHDVTSYAGGNSIGNIVALIEEHAQKGLDLVCLDYVQCIDVPNRSSDYEKAKNAELAIRLLAKRLNIVIWMASQVTPQADGSIASRGSKEWENGSVLNLVMQEIPDEVLKKPVNQDIKSRVSGIDHPLMGYVKKSRHGRKPKKSYFYLSPNLDIEEIP